MTEQMRDDYKKINHCPIEAIKLTKVGDDKLQLLYTPYGAAESILTDQYYRDIDHFNSDFFSDYLVYPNEETSDPGVLVKDVCSDITQIMYTDDTTGADKEGETLTEGEIRQIAVDNGISDYNPDQVNEEILKVNQLLNKISEIRNDQHLDAQTISSLKYDLYKKRETIKSLLDTVQKLQKRNSGLETQLKSTESLLKRCNADLNKAFLSEKSKYDSVTSNYSWQGDDLDNPSYTTRYANKTKNVDYLDPTLTYIHQTVIPANA